MKKSLVITLAIMFVLGIASTAFAAANPFVDVPAKHWAYEAVSKLAKAGIVDGYGDGTFRGDKNMTRYEMAQIVAKAMARSDMADAQMKATIDKLAVEFAAELNTLGVRVGKLEANASSVKITADGRLRYMDNFDLSDVSGKDRIQERVRLYINGNVSDQVAFSGRVSSQWTTADEDTASNTNTVAYDYGFFTLKNIAPRVNAELGRNTLFLGQGLLADTVGGFDAAKFTYANRKFKAWTAYGDIAPAGGKLFNSKYAAATSVAGKITVYDKDTYKVYIPGYDSTWYVSDVKLRDGRHTYLDVDKDKIYYVDHLHSYLKDVSPEPQVFDVMIPVAEVKGDKTANIWVTNLSYDFSKKFSMTGTYIKPMTKVLDDAGLTTWGASAKYVFSPDWNVFVDYAKSDVATNNTGWWSKLSYKGANKNVAHSYGWYVDYRNVEPNAVDIGLTTLNVGDQVNGTKGFGVGFTYALYKNAVMTAEYEDLEGTNGKDHDGFTLVKVDFSF